MNDFNNERYIEALKAHESGKIEKARQIYLNILREDPFHFDSINMLGVIATQLHKYINAIKIFKYAIKLNPGNPSIYSNLTIALIAVGQNEEALRFCSYALIIKKDFIEAYSNIALALNESKRFVESLKISENTICKAPQLITSYINRSNSYFEGEDYLLSIKNIRNALIIDPNNIDALYNLANVLKQLGQFNESKDYYTRVLSINKNFVQARFNKSIVELLLGDFKNGFQNYEARWDNRESVLTGGVRVFDKPLWDGQYDIKDKKILIWFEQGLGDSIQFSRYILKVKEIAKEVYVEIQEPLLALFKCSFKGLNIYLRGSKLPEFDFHCPMLSLPLKLNVSLTKMYSPFRYLNGDSNLVEKWKKKLGENKKKRIGIFWTSNSKHKENSKRNIKLDEVIKILSNKNIEVHCLQKNLESFELRQLREHKIRIYCDELADLNETAALCEMMDLVISIDTSIAHLSAALGRKTWIMLQFVSDWRWLTERNDSPWYKSVVLYRQDKIGNWSYVVQEIEKDLNNFINQ
jgi:tetratricopeptide (TPR) repeat protein